MIVLIVYMYILFRRGCIRVEIGRIYPTYVH